MAKADMTTHSISLIELPYIHKLLDPFYL